MDAGAAGVQIEPRSRPVGDLANLTIWDDPAIRGALSWYLDVAENRRPAKFRIAATVPAQLDPPASSEDALWVELDRLTPILLHELQGPAEVYGSSFSSALRTRVS
jgi:hypothetical protein